MISIIVQCTFLNVPLLLANPGQNPTGQNPTLTKPHQLFSVKDKTPLFNFSWNNNINEQNFIYN